MSTSTIEDQFLQLIQENRGIIHKVCGLYGTSLYNRQDLFQEILVQLWKAYPHYRGEAKISTWMYRVALNTAITDFRKQQRTIPSIPLDNVGIHEYTEGHDELSEKWLMLRQAIEGLSEIEKAIVMLYLEERTYEEMEDVLGISQTTLRVKMNRIKEKLKKRVATME